MNAHKDEVLTWDDWPRLKDIGMKEKMDEAEANQSH